MVMANADRIGRALDLCRDGLRPKCEATWEAFYGDDWLATVNGMLHNPQRDPSTNDIAFILNCVKATWNQVFGQGFGPSVRSLVFEVADARNLWAHQEPISSDDALNYLDSMERLLREFGDNEHRSAIKQLRRDLMRQMFSEEARAERRKTAAKPTEGDPTAG